MSWFYKPKHPPARPPERCQRCRVRAPTEHIAMLSQGQETASSKPAHDWWLCVECAAELRRGEPPTS